MVVSSKRKSKNFHRRADCVVSGNRLESLVSNFNQAILPDYAGERICYFVDFVESLKIIPLMGTNFSRAGLTHEDSLRVIASMFQLYGDKVHGDVSIIIYKGDKDKVSLGSYM